MIDGGHKTAAPIVTLGEKQAADLLEAYARFVVRNTIIIAGLQPGANADCMVQAAKDDLTMALNIAADLREGQGIDVALEELQPGGIGDKLIQHLAGSLGDG